MRPGVPWNVKGIEAEAREMAQLAARRAGVSLGDYLTQLIMTEGRGSAPVGHGYPQQQFQPGNGTYGAQPQPVYQPPVPSLRYPQAFPQAPQQPQPQQYQPLHPHQSFPGQQGFGPQQQPRPDQGDAFMGAAQSLDGQIRGSEFAVVAHGLRDLADRLESSERRAQTAISTVNQSVAAMQDRIDAAERVKQLADVAFTSAADALAQSARDQASAFENLETTVRQVQKRLIDIESGRSEWPGKDSVGRLETALTQLQKRLGEMESSKADSTQKDQFARLEISLNQLQKRLSEMETARSEFPHKEALTRLEASIAEVRNGAVESDKRSRDDLTQLAKFMRELGSRVEATERGMQNASGQTKSLTEGVAARLDALEARSASMFDEMRGQLTTMDGRLAQASSSKVGVAPETFEALRRSVDSLASRFDTISDPAASPFAGPMEAIESTLGALTTKIEEGEKRSAESVSTVSNALKAISTRLEESDKKHDKTLQQFTRRLDDADRKTTEQAYAVEDALKALTQRLEVSDKKHKEAIGGLRLTVDGLVAKAAADALPVEQPYHRTTSTPSALSEIQSFTPPPVRAPEPPPIVRTPEPPPYATSLSQSLSHSVPSPPSFEDELPKEDEFSVSALETIMSRPLAGDMHEPQAFAGDKFDAELPGLDADDAMQPRKADDFLTQARRAAQAAAQADAERVQSRRPSLSAYTTGETGGRKIGRLAIVTIACIAVVAGIVALLFTLPGGNDEGINRPDAGDSIGEILNGPEAAPAAPAAPAEATPPPAPAAEFAPPTSTEGVAEVPASVAAQPNGLGAPVQPAPTEFTAGTSALPGGATPDTSVAALETNATRGDAKSQFLLALRYAEGRGVEKDDAKALNLVTKSAQQGLVVAQYRLGAMYERGIGVAKDLPNAKSWYERAAKGGNRKAMHNLAVLFADGVGGTPDFAQAATWFRQGAEYGLADSQYNYAILLERGMGTEKNLSEAAKWYAVASSQGDAGAAERLAALKASMSPTEIGPALEAARKFKPKALDPAANELPAVNG